jgi:hypothetical protein
MIMNGEQVKIWKDTVTAYFKVLSKHLTGDSEENNQKLQSGQPVTWLRF